MKPPLIENYRTEIAGQAIISAFAYDGLKNKNNADSMALLNQLSTAAKSSSQTDFTRQVASNPIYNRVVKESTYQISDTQVYNFFKNSTILRIENQGKTSGLQALLVRYNDSNQLAQFTAGAVPFSEFVVSGILETNIAAGYPVKQSKALSDTWQSWKSEGINLNGIELFSNSLGYAVNNAALANSNINYKLHIGFGGFGYNGSALNRITTSTRTGVFPDKYFGTFSEYQQYTNNIYQKNNLSTDKIFNFVCGKDGVPTYQDYLIGTIVPLISPEKDSAWYIPGPRGPLGLLDHTLGNYNKCTDSDSAYFDYYQQPQFDREFNRPDQISPAFSLSYRDGNQVQISTTSSGNLIITRLNKILEPTEIFQVYTVQPGDNASKIEDRFNMPRGSLSRYNTDITDRNIIYAGEQLYIPNGSHLETTTTPNGQVIKSFDNDNVLAGTITDTFDNVGGVNRVVDTVVNGRSVVFNQHANSTDLANGEQAGDFTTIGLTIDGLDVSFAPLTCNAIDYAYDSALEIIRDRDSGQLGQLVDVNDRTVSNGWKTSTDTTTSTTNGKTPSWPETVEGQRFGTALTDAQSLLAAVKSGNPLPIATSFFNLASHMSRHVVIDPVSRRPMLDSYGNEIIKGGDEALSTITTLGNFSNGLNAVTSLLSFSDALERGDTLAALSSGGGLTQAGFKLYQSYLNVQIAGIYALGEHITADVVDRLASLTAESAFVNEALKGLADKLPVLSLINGLANGDIASIVSSIATLANFHVVGWIIAGIQIISSIFDDGPDVHGNAVFVSNGDGIHVHPVMTVNSDNGGNGAVSALNNLLTVLESTFKSSDGLGLIAQRLPSLYFRASESGSSFSLSYKDAITGQTYQRLFDAQGKFTMELTDRNNPFTPFNPFNAITINHPDFGKGLAQQFVEAAYNSGAIAPQWMVKTVDAQASRGQDVPIYVDTTYYDDDGNQRTYQVYQGTKHIGFPRDPYAGFTTLQRAAALGQLLPTDPGDALHAPLNAQQSARPIALDLDGNEGISVTKRAEGGGVLADVDGDGFAEESDWINPRDGILAIDRNGDGKISGGSEIFNDSRVDMSKRGLHALDELEANGDGKITADDFAYSELKVWQDINHDGQAQDFEVSSLTKLGITAIEINSGTFTMNGQVRTIQNVALQADSAGIITQSLGNSLLVIKEADESSLLALAAADYGQVSDLTVRNAHTHKSTDGQLTVVDELLDGVEDVAISVSIAQLLENDISASGTTRSITSVSNAIGGTVNLDQASGTIKFIPNLNFNGKASFDYTVTDSAGRQATAKTFIDIAAINDNPVITSKSFSRAANLADIGTSLVYYSDSDHPSTGVVFNLPFNAVFGDAITDPIKIGFHSVVSSNFQTGYIGFQNGVMYLGTNSQPYGLGRLSYDLPTKWQPISILEPNRGKIIASDTESVLSDLSYKLLNDVQFGKLNFNSNTGEWSYLPNSYPLNDSSSDAFVVEVTDKDKGSSQLKVVIKQLNPT